MRDASLHTFKSTIAWCQKSIAGIATDAAAVSMRLSISWQCWKILSELRSSGTYSVTPKTWWYWRYQRYRLEMYHFCWYHQTTAMVVPVLP